MLSCDVELMIEDAFRFGEMETAAWLAQCSDEEVVRICDVAYFSIMYGRTTPSGNSMILAKAVAIAAVYVHERKPRALRRGRRDLSAALPEWSKNPRARLDWNLQNSYAEFFAVGDDFIDFWAEDPAKARAACALRRDVFKQFGNGWVSAPSEK